MQTLFDGRYSEPDSPASDRVPTQASHGEGPHLLMKLTPWHRVFFGNVRDRLPFFRGESPLHLTSEPAPFWDDVFVTRGLPLAALRQSALYHLFIVTALWGLSHTLLLRKPDLAVRSPFEHQRITYYSVSEYLPPINDAAEPPPAKEAKKGEPAYAKQFIRSIRSDAESRAQTIVAAPKLKLPHDVPVPNIVAWTPVPAAVPQAAASHDGKQLMASAMQAVAPPAPSITRQLAQLRVDQQTDVVEPTPPVDGAKLRVPADLVSKAVVEPAPALSQTQVNKPNLPVPSAVEPSPDAQNAPTKLGDINMAAKLTVVEPALVMAEQRARGSLLAGTAQKAVSKGVSGNVGAVPPPPTTQSGGGQSGGSQAAGQLIALGIHPVAAVGPISIPQGSRSGTFQAGPEGKPGAPGTPEIKGGGTNNGTGGNGATKPSHGDGGGFNGITVGRGESTPPGGVVVASGSSKEGVKPATNPMANKTLLASLGHTSVTDLARSSRPGATPLPSEPKIEDKVFGVKKYYQMTLNMPNLTSRGGSWIVRFAELNVSADRGELTAPIAVQKVDPAYSADLMREQVEGTVVLYAIIHADGSVGEVRVLRGVDDRLDAKAREAFMKWHFRPGTKNGRVVDLEAVVQIPFIAKRLPY